MRGLPLALVLRGPIRISTSPDGAEALRDYVTVPPTNMLQRPGRSGGFVKLGRFSGGTGTGRGYAYDSPTAFRDCWKKGPAIAATGFSIFSGREKREEYEALRAGVLKELLAAEVVRMGAGASGGGAQTKRQAKAMKSIPVGGGFALLGSQ